MYKFSTVEVFKLHFVAHDESVTPEGADLLSSALQRLKRLCHGLIYFNPL